MKKIAEEMKKRTEGKTEAYFTKEKSRFELLLQKLDPEIVRKDKKCSALRDEIKDLKKECSLSKKSLDSLISAIKKIQSDDERFDENTKRKRTELDLRKELLIKDEIKYLGMRNELKIVIAIHRQNNLSGRPEQPDELEAHGRRKVYAAALRVILTLSGEQLYREKSSIAADELELEKDNKQRQVYQKQIEKEQQKKESIEKKHLQSEEELKRKRSTLREINQQLKALHEKRFELDKYAAMMGFCSDWTLKVVEEKTFSQKFGVEMLNEEAASEDESKAQCQSAKRSR
jgi:septal ring factor EnvC (AmiA/AmiB activator)